MLFLFENPPMQTDICFCFVLLRLDKKHFKPKKIIEKKIKHPKRQAFYSFFINDPRDGYGWLRLKKTFPNIVFIIYIN